MVSRFNNLSSIKLRLTSDKYLKVIKFIDYAHPPKVDELDRVCTYRVIHLELII